MKKLLNKIWNATVNYNNKNILSLLEMDKGTRLLDLGCDDGEWTLKLAKKTDTSNIYGVDIVDKRVKKAQSKGIKIKKFDLNSQFKFKDNTFDVVHANQVIEHLYDSDNFLSEILRVLKKGGYAIISTENGSSWHNIFAAIMGWQIFSLTNISKKKYGIGNPLATLQNQRVTLESWNHVRIYNIRGLKELFEAHGFKVEKIKGSGYFPLHPFLGNIDKTHCHFMTFKIRKF